MATPSGGKFRSKRSHYSRKPYERPKPKSLLARVSDTVKDFITPSWLNNLWNNPNDDDGEGSSRSSTPELPQPDSQPDGQAAGAGTPNFMPSAVATSTPDINLRTGKEALSMPGPSSMETTPIVQLQEDVVRDGSRRDIKNDEDDVVIIEEEQPSTSTGIRHTPLPFRNYANPIGTSTPNEDMPLLSGRKPVIDKDDASDTSVSTSGCSSLVPHVDRMDHREKLSKKNLDRLSEMGHSNSLAKSSLWTDMSSSAVPSGAGAAAAALSTSRPQPSISSGKRPAFNSSYFGSPRLIGESRPKHASPFYPGRTQFGGSSAQRSSLLKRPRDSPYEVHLPVKRNIRPKPAQWDLQDTIGGATSSTAKKILDTLERMSTPLLDAKKIPLSPAASPYSFRPPSRLANRPGTSRTNTPPVSGLHVAHQASIKSNRQPPVSMVIDLENEDRVTASTSDEVLPTSTATPTISTAPSFRFGAPVTSSTPAVTGFSEGPAGGREKSGGKMKSKSRNTGHYSAQKQDEEVCEIPDLPKVALPLSKGLPTFNFGSSLTPTATSSASQSSQSSSATASTKNVSLASSISSKSTASSSSAVPLFQFASPTSTAMSTATSSATSSSEGPQFTFASPIIKQTGSSSTSSSSNSSSNVTTFTFSMPRQTPYSTSKPSSHAPLGGKKPSFETPERTRRKGDKDIVEVRDEEEEYQGGIRVAKELKTGSCLEAFGIRPTQNGPVPSSSSKVQAHPVKESGTKMDNGPLKGSQKTGASNLQNDTSSKSLSILNKFKPAANSCTIQNTEDASKRAACAAPKPGQSTSKPATSTTAFGGKSSSLLDKFKPAANSWECNTCLIRNNEDISKCLACETPKPGQSVSKSAASSSSSDSKQPPMFNSLASKFSKESDECLITNKDTLDKCAGQSKGGEATKTQQKDHVANNLIAEKFKAAPGEWECDTCMIRNKATILKCVACETPKPGSQPALSAPPASAFKFGSSSLSNGDATGAFKFGNSSTSDTLNSNTNASSGVGFKLPAGMSLGQSIKPSSIDINGTTASSASGGFKLPANFSLSKANSNSSATSTTAASEVNSKESSSLGQAKSEQKLEVKVPAGMKFGASSSEPSATSGGFKLGAGASSGGLIFGQNNASSKLDSSSSSIGGGFKFGQSSATVGQSLLDKDGPPPNVNIFQSNATEGDGSAAQKSLTFGAGPPTSAGTDEKKSDSAASTLTFSTSSSTKESTLNPDAPSFQFGAGAATFGGAKATDSSSTSAESKPMFSFGSSASSGASSSGPTSASTTPSFTFGSSSATSKPDSVKGLKTDSKAGFTLGGTAPSQGIGSGSTFGAKPQEPAATSTSTFTFGQSVAVPEKTPSAPTFNFGAGASTVPTMKEEPAKPAVFSFGTQNQSNSQGGSGFSFGASATSSAAPAQSTPSFSFGTADKAPAASSSGGFTFGATPNSTSQFTGSSTSGFGGFGSNRSSTNPSPAFGAPPAATQPPSTFTFGSAAPATSANSNPFGGSSTPATNATPFGGQSANPTFGSTNSQPQGFGASAPTQGSVFGSTTSATNNSAFGSGLGSATTGGFGASTNATPGFGNNPAPAFGSGTTNAPSGGFQFGKSTPTFNFGSTNNAAPAGPAPAPAAFQFTGSQPNQAPAATPQPAGGFNFSGAGQPTSFNFGAGTPQAAATAYQFQASAGGTDGNPFSASSTPGNNPLSGRKIKKAVRRNAKR